MQLRSLVSLLGAASLAAAQTTGNGTVTGKMGDARQVKNNPVGETWVATFDGTQGVKGTVTAVGWTLGVNYTVDVTGLPEGKGPFSTHPTRPCVSTFRLRLILPFRLPRPRQGCPCWRHLRRHRRPSRLVRAWPGSPLRGLAPADLRGWRSVWKIRQG
jgi:hypothetical protein